MPPADSGGRRDTIRISYPSHLAPEFVMGAARCTVLDLSARGCQVQTPAPTRARIGDNLRGTLRFRDGQSLAIDARVSRVETDRVNLEFLADIPQRFIERELMLFGDQGRDRRRFFRLQYQCVPGPTLVVRGGVQFPIVEISEAAIVLSNEDINAFMRGQQVMGSIIFHDRKALPIIGNIFRMTAKRVIILLGRFIPTARVMQEQQHVLQALRG